MITGFLPGIFPGFIYLFTGSVLFSIIAHSFLNSMIFLIPVLSAVLQKAGLLPGMETPFWIFNWIDLLAVVGLIPGIPGGRRLFKNR